MASPGSAPLYNTCCCNLPLLVELVGGEVDRRAYLMSCSEPVGSFGITYQMDKIVLSPKGQDDTRTYECQVDRDSATGSYAHAEGDVAHDRKNRSDEIAGSNYVDWFIALASVIK